MYLFKSEQFPFWRFAPAGNMRLLSAFGGSTHYQMPSVDTGAPDESKIWMTFENEMQFPGEGKNRFVVYFEHGKALTIRKIVKANE